MSTGITMVIPCPGCENECEVCLSVLNGHPVCLGGNHCPTGESFALAEYQRLRMHGAYASSQTSGSSSATCEAE